MSSDILASLQEGEEWIAKLEQDQAKFELDIISHQESLSDVSLAMLQFGLAKTIEAIEQIKLEMMMFSGEDKDEN